MNARNSGGPAFPTPPAQGQSWRGMAPCDGMTLRDYFAARAMQALITGLVTQQSGRDDWLDSDQWAPGQAYAVADAMLSERAKHQEIK